MKKIFNYSICTLSVLVPMSILVWAVVANPMPMWSLCFVFGILAIAVFAFRKYQQVKDGNERADDARDMVMIYGFVVAFLLPAIAIVTAAITRQGLEVTEALGLPCEAAIGWMFLCGGCNIVADLCRRGAPKNVGYTVSVLFAALFSLIVALACGFDLLEFYTGFELPQFWGQALGMLCPLSAVICIGGLGLGTALDRN